MPTTDTQALPDAQAEEPAAPLEAAEQMEADTAADPLKQTAGNEWRARNRDPQIPQS